MAVTRIVRYRTKPEFAEENADLVRAVFSELATVQPAEMHYSSFRLDDGVTFIHVAVFDGETNPLTTSPAFSAFQAQIADRCAEGPISAVATTVGAYSFQLG